MSHEITVREDGFAEAIYSRTPAWHLLGHVEKDRDLVSDDLIPYVDWTPLLQPLLRTSKDGEQHHSKYAVSVVRSDTEEELGSVSPNYQTYGHLDGIRLLDTLMMDGIMKYEAAFSLQGGRNVVVVAQIPGVYEVAEGDASLPFIMAIFNHTGQQRVRFLPTAIRPVCANTVGMALAQGKGQILSVRHSGDMELKMDQVRDALSEINEAFTDHTKVARQLAQVKVTNDTWVPFLNDLFPVPQVTDPEFTQRKQNSVRQTRMAIKRNFLEDPAQQIPSTRHSWYAAFNAVTQWVDHHEYKGTDDVAKAETRFRVANLGTGNDLKTKAWSSAIDHALLEN